MHTEETGKPHPARSQNQNHRHTQARGQTCREQGSNPGFISCSIHLGSDEKCRAWSRSKKVQELAPPGLAMFSHPNLTQRDYRDVCRCPYGVSCVDTSI